MADSPAVDVPFDRLQLPLGGYQQVVVHPRPELALDYEQGGSPFTAPVYAMEFTGVDPGFVTSHSNLILDKRGLVRLQRLTTLLKQPLHPSYAYDYMFKGVKYFQIERS